MYKVNDYPKISIITVCFNSEETLEQTILSVVNQTYQNIEYIIIDGGSTDKTVDIIKKYEDKIAYWVSESDNGIYDAMNKGIDRATGDYIYFLGSDDWLVSKAVISDIIKYILDNKGFDFYYGKVYLFDEYYDLIKENGKQLEIKDIKYGCMCPHQALFLKAKVMKAKFNIDYKIAADFEFFLRNIVEGKKIFYFDYFVAFYNVNGASSNIILYSEYECIIQKFLDEKYSINIQKLKKYAEKKYVGQKIIKNMICFVIGKKQWLKLKGWKEYQVDKNGCFRI